MFCTEYVENLRWRLLCVSSVFSVRKDARWWKWPSILQFLESAWSLTIARTYLFDICKKILKWHLQENIQLTHAKKYPFDNCKKISLWKLQENIHLTFARKHFMTWMLGCQCCLCVFWGVIKIFVFSIHPFRFVLTLAIFVLTLAREYFMTQGWLACQSWLCVFCAVIIYLSSFQFVHLNLSNFLLTFVLTLAKKSHHLQAGLPASAVPVCILCRHHIFVFSDLFNSSI